MTKSIVELLLGDLEEKRAYRQFMRRVNALPKDYRFTFKKMQHYLYHFGSAGCDMALYTNLVDLFETSAAEGKPVLTVIGGDASAFCDELIRATAVDAFTSREKLNKEIMEHFHREDK